VRKSSSLASNNHCWKSQFTQIKEQGMSLERPELGAGWAGAQTDRLQRSRI